MSDGNWGSGWAAGINTAEEAITRSMAQYHKEAEAKREAVATGDQIAHFELPDPSNPEKTIPLFDKKHIDAWDRMSAQQKAYSQGGYEAMARMLFQSKQHMATSPTPVYNESNQIIGERGKGGGLHFYPQDIRNPQVGQQKQLAATQKPLFHEIKTIQSEFQKDYKSTPDAFLSGAGTEVIPGSGGTPMGQIPTPMGPISTATQAQATEGAAQPADITFGGKKLDPKTYTYLLQRARQHSMLKQAVTAPDPMKVLGALKFIQDNPNDPRTPKWRKWVQSQVGTQGPAVDIATPEQSDEQPEEPPPEEEPE